MIRFANRDKIEQANPLLDLLVDDLAYADRADRALAHACELAGARTAHLYLRAEGGRRLRLERSYVHHHVVPDGSADLTRSHPMAAGDALHRGTATMLTLSGDDPAGALEASLSPHLELDASDASVGAETMATPMGRMHALALDGSDGVAALVLLGPYSSTLDAGRHRRLQGLRRVYSAVFLEAYRLERARARLDDALERLATAGRLQGSALDADQFLTLLISLAVRATDASGGFVAVLDGEDRMRLRATQDLPADFDERLLDPVTGMFEWTLAAEGGALLVRDIEAAVAVGFQSLLAVPLTHDDTHLGIMAIFRTSGGGSVPGQSLDMLTAFADQGRMMLGRAHSFKAFATDFVATLAGLSEILDRRRTFTIGHHAAVTTVAVQLGVALGLDSSDVEILRIAASIHDVGMAAAGQDDRGFLASDTEHPTIGAALVSSLPLPQEVSRAIATHHEWFDGWGFPDGASGHDIPIHGRVLAIAEFVAEMAAPDPVRAAWPVDRIAAELRRRSGSQFDPDLVEIAVSLVPLAVAATTALLKE